MSKLTETRKDLINELIGLIVTKGVYDIEKKEYRLNLYQGDDNEDKRIDVVVEDRIGEYIMDMVWALTYHKKDGSPDIPLVETNESNNPISELFADDLDNLVNFIKGFSEEDFTACNNFYNNGL